MKKTLTFLLPMFCATFSFAQSSPETYRIYNKNGEQVAFTDMISEIQNAQVVLFGELHNNAIVHWLQLKVTESLYEAKKEQLVLAAEMFESDDQLILNEYLNGLYAEKNFKQEAKIWNNYATDYRPLVEFAKAHHLTFCAANIPRRYASMVAKRGLASLDSLSKIAKSYIAPLPFEIDTSAPGYGALLHMSHGDTEASINFLHAQAVKDATMAHFISLASAKNGLTLHYNGDYHSKEGGGIYWYLKRAHPKWEVATISTVEAEQFDFNPEYKGRADFIIIVPENMTKTY
jgi:uncharacterized iron-regulated protein